MGEIYISENMKYPYSTTKVVVSGYSRLRQGLREVKVKSALKFNRISWTGRQIFEIDPRIVECFTRVHRSATMSIIIYLIVRLQRKFITERRNTRTPFAIFIKSTEIYYT